jgi:hypothetical protein
MAYGLAEGFFSSQAVFFDMDNDGEIWHVTKINSDVI